MGHKNNTCHLFNAAVYKAPPHALCVTMLTGPHQVGREELRTEKLKLQERSAPHNP